MRLRGKVAIVTGAGKGIGKTIAIGLSKEGARVVVCSRTKAQLDAVVEEILSWHGDAYAIAKDLTLEEQVCQLVQETRRKYGKIDILVNNAGGYPSDIYGDNDISIKIWDRTEETWDRIIETNLKTTFLCINMVVPYMIKEKTGGHIINIASRMGRNASEMGAYAAAKSAVLAPTKTTAIQAIEYGIYVNAISPGIIETPGQRVYNSSINVDNKSMGDTDSVLKAILYLLCDAPEVMIGQSMDLFQKV